MVELKGTEKQIKYANDLRKYFLRNIEMMREQASVNGRLIAKELGEEFPPIIRRDKENKELRFAIGNKYLDKVEEIIKNEENAVAFINRESMDIKEVAEIIKNGRLY